MNATDWKLGLSTCATNSLEKEVFEAYAENGIRIMEISLPTAMYDSIRWKSIAGYAKETDVEIRSIHLPYYPFETLDLSSPDAAVRKAALEMQTDLLARASEIGTRIAVIHPSGEPYLETERSERLKCAQDALASLAEKASAYGTTIAVENLPRTCLGNCIADMKYLTAGNEALRICFDTNHLLTQNNADFVRALGHLFVNMHVSDYDFVDEKHWMPYEGKNDWVELVALLEQVGYDGPFLYEVPRTKPRALDRRELTFADYKPNYEACIHKRPAPKIV